MPGDGRLRVVGGNTLSGAEGGEQDKAEGPHASGLRISLAVRVIARDAYEATAAPIRPINAWLMTNLLIAVVFRQSMGRLGEANFSSSSRQSG